MINEKASLQIQDLICIIGNLKSDRDKSSLYSNILNPQKLNFILRTKHNGESEATRASNSLRFISYREFPQHEELFLIDASSIHAVQRYLAQIKRLDTLQTGYNNANLKDLDWYLKGVQKLNLSQVRQISIDMGTIHSLPQGFLSKMHKSLNKMKSTVCLKIKALGLKLHDLAVKRTRHLVLTLKTLMTLHFEMLTTTIEGLELFHVLQPITLKRSNIIDIVLELQDMNETSQARTLRQLAGILCRAHQVIRMKLNFSGWKKKFFMYDQTFWNSLSGMPLLSDLSMLLNSVDADNLFIRTSVQALKKLQCLRRISLSFKDSAINDQHLIKLTDIWDHNKKLQSLSLHVGSQSIYQEGYEMLTNSFSHLIYLKDLDLDFKECLNLRYEENSMLELTPHCQIHRLKTNYATELDTNPNLSLNFVSLNQLKVLELSFSCSSTQIICNFLKKLESLKKLQSLDLSIYSEEQRLQEIFAIESLIYPAITKIRFCLTGTEDVEEEAAVYLLQKFSSNTTLKTLDVELPFRVGRTDRKKLSFVSELSNSGFDLEDFQVCMDLSKNLEGICDILLKFIANLSKLKHLNLIITNPASQSLFLVGILEILAKNIEVRTVKLVTQMTDKDLFAFTEKIVALNRPDIRFDLKITLF